MPLLQHEDRHCPYPRHCHARFRPLFLLGTCRVGGGVGVDGQLATVPEQRLCHEGTVPTAAATCNRSFFKRRLLERLNAVPFCPKPVLETIGFAQELAWVCFEVGLLFFCRTGSTEISEAIDPDLVRQD